MGKDSAESFTVIGMVLQSVPAGEYDRRVVILTRESGKITCFARRARKQGSPLMGAVEPFCFGRFTLTEGRSALTLVAADIDHYFETLRGDFTLACYGAYFLEVMECLTRENNDEAMLLLLLYRALRVLENGKIEPELVRAVFELKTVVLEGELPELSARRRESMHPSAVYAVQFITESSIEKLFSFRVSDEVLKDLLMYSEEAVHRCAGREFRSMKVLRSML